MCDNWKELPSSLIAVSECKCDKYYESVCPNCHGTGRIGRDMSIAEVVDDYKRNVEEWMKKMNAGGPLLPSGERVMVKQ